MARPRIGITIDTHDQPDQYESPTTYAAAVAKAGGLPFLLPYKTDLSLVPQYVDALDGILFAGGNDLDPALFGETYHPKAVPIDPDRQRFELALLEEVEHTADAGARNLSRITAHEPLSRREPRAVPARDRAQAAAGTSEGGWRDVAHGVGLNADSWVAQATGKTEINANSSHKQAIKQVGRGLRIIGTAHRWGHRRN